MKSIPLSTLTEREAKERVIALVQGVKNAVGATSPLCYQGVDDPITKHLGITVIEQNQGSDASEGMYVRPRENSPERPTIIVDTRVNDPDRLNFTFFHEVAHRLVGEDMDLLEYLNERAYTNYDQVLEKLCNVGAAEFLTPADEVRAIIDERGFSISLIEELDQLYAASKPAIAIQLAQCALHECVVVVCEYGKLPSVKVDNPLLPDSVRTTNCLFTSYASCSPSFRKSAGRYVTIPRDHLLWAIYESRSPKAGMANIPFRSGTVWPVRCEGFFYLGKVYAAFNVTEPPSPWQMSLFG